MTPQCGRYQNSELGRYMLAIPQSIQVQYKGRCDEKRLGDY